MYTTIFFDLDGTIIDSGIGVTNSVSYALEKFGISVNDRSELYRFIGPPLNISFMEYYGFSAKQTETAVAYYREYYRDKGMYENVLYPGVVDMLDTLKKAGIRLVIATSKPEEFVIDILKSLDIYKYFDFIGAATMDTSRQKKEDIIAYVLERFDITDKDSVLMVGDRHFDIDGARANGIASAGVLYGYGDRQEFESAGADYIVSSTEELLDLIGV